MRVLIHAPAKSAMQSGLARAGAWVLQPLDGRPGGPEPVMGWAPASSTADEVCLSFPCLAAAQDHAARQGWEVVVLPAQSRRVTPRNFAQTIK